MNNQELVLKSRRTTHSWEKKKEGDLQVIHPFLYIVVVRHNKFYNICFRMASSFFNMLIQTRKKKMLIQIVSHIIFVKKQKSCSAEKYTIGNFFSSF